MIDGFIGAWNGSNMEPSSKVDPTFFATDLKIRRLTQCTTDEDGPPRTVQPAKPNVDKGSKSSDGFGRWTKIKVRFPKRYNHDQIASVYSCSEFINLIRMKGYIDVVDGCW